MITSLSDGPKVTVSIPQSAFNASIDMPYQALPPGVEHTLIGLGWSPAYSIGMDTTLFHRNTGPYADGYYHWYEAVALESLNLITLGMQRDNAAPGDGGAAMAVGMR